jgi:hypothetical protein
MATSLDYIFPPFLSLAIRFWQFFEDCRPGYRVCLLHGQKKRAKLIKAVFGY